jgi:hypothetical protein
MQQSPYWEANRFLASQELPHISRKPKVHYRFHKCPPPIPILSQLYPVHILSPTSLRSILILSSHLHLGLHSGLFPLGFPTKTCKRLPLPILTTYPVYLILLDFITRTIVGEQYRSLSSSICSFLHSRYLVPLRPKYSFQHPILKHPRTTFLSQSQQPSFTPIQNNRQKYNSLYTSSYL